MGFFNQGIQLPPLSEILEGVEQERRRRQADSPFQLPSPVQAEPIAPLQGLGLALAQALQVAGRGLNPNVPVTDFLGDLRARRQQLADQQTRQQQQQALLQLQQQNRQEDITRQDADRAIGRQREDEREIRSAQRRRDEVQLSREDAAAAAKAKDELERDLAKIRADAQRDVAEIAAASRLAVAGARPKGTPSILPQVKEGALQFIDLVESGELSASAAIKAYRRRVAANSSQMEPDEAEDAMVFIRSELREEIANEEAEKGRGAGLVEGQLTPGVPAQGILDLVNAFGAIRFDDQGSLDAAAEASQMQEALRAEVAAGRGQGEAAKQLRRQLAELAQRR